MSESQPSKHISIGTLRRELVDYLGEIFPEFEVTEQRDDSLMVAGPEGEEHQIFFGNMHAAIQSLHENTLENRRRIYASFTRAMNSTETLIDSTSERLAGKLMPRIIHMDQLRSMISQIEIPIPHRTLGAMPLAVVYVIDLPESVAFVNDDTADKLEMTEAQMHQRSLINLDPQGVFSQNIREFKPGHIAVVKTSDSYDAARLLLVPQSLPEDTILCAAIPDRDTLILAVMEDDTVFDMVDQMAKIPGSDRLIYDQAIEVRSTGFSIRA